MAKGDVKKFFPGDQIMVDFQGVACRGEVIRQSSASQYVMAKITLPDVELDMGHIGPHMDPQPFVCVPESRVSKVEE